MNDQSKHKELVDMTNEQLWQLFPVILSPHEEKWKDIYKEEASHLLDIIGGNIERINHIGSTSVPGLTAKPTIDILVEIREDTNISELISIMKSEGYIYLEQPDKPAPHMVFYKGYTPQGFAENVFHIHVRYPGDWDEIYFRDYLRTHPDIAGEYGALKINLKETYGYNRDAYTNAKTDFIQKINRLARSNREK